MADALGSYSFAHAHVISNPKKCTTCQDLNSMVCPSRNLMTFNVLQVRSKYWSHFAWLATSNPTLASQFETTGDSEILTPTIATNQQPAADPVTMVTKICFLPNSNPRTRSDQRMASIPNLATQTTDRRFRNFDSHHCNQSTTNSRSDHHGHKNMFSPEYQSICSLGSVVTNEWLVSLILPRRPSAIQIF